MVALLNGTLFSENLLNLYFKVLETINQVLLTAQAFSEHNSTIEPEATCEKVMFCGSQYMQALRRTPQLSQIKANPRLCQEVARIYDHDVILVPFFFDEKIDRLTEKSIVKSPTQF